MTTLYLHLLQIVPLTAEYIVNFSYNPLTVKIQLEFIDYTMRAATRFLASHSNPASAKGALGRPSPLALLPPIPLYRRLLRAHRKCLPRDMRLLGDEYIKSEFRAHRTTENPVHIVSATYGQLLESQYKPKSAWRAPTQ